MRQATCYSSKVTDYVAMFLFGFKVNPASKFASFLPIKLPNEIQSLQFSNRGKTQEITRMMNVLALGLLLTSLVTAGFFSPNHEKQMSKEDVIVKEGHRVVVVEFEKDDGNTKVSISPQDSPGFHHVDGKGNMKERLSEKMEDAKEKMKEAISSDLPEVEEEEEVHRGFSPRELVCDAYGKCKHKIASAIGKTKEAVSEKAHEAADKVYEVEGEAKEAVSEAIGKVKDTVTHTVHTASDKARESKESVKETASDVSSKAKDKVAEKASELKEGAKDVIDTTKRKKKEVETDASEKMEGTKEKISEKAKEAEEMVENALNKGKQGAQRVKEEGKKELRETFRRAREVASDVISYMVPSVSMVSVSGVLHLLGFSVAYGMCIWVTFASSYVLATSLPRHQFAMVQSKIYPVYFKAMTYSLGMALLGHLLSQGKRLSPVSVGMFQGFNLLMSLLMVLVNLLYLEPRATKVMFERMKKEKEEGRGKESVHDTEPSGRVVDSSAQTATAPAPAGRGVSASGTSTTRDSSQEKQADIATNYQIIRMSEILRRLNSYSSFLNVLTLMSLTCHLVHLGHRLHTVC